MLQKRKSKWFIYLCVCCGAIVWPSALNQKRRKQQEKKSTHLGDVCKVVSGSSLPGEGLEERDDRVSRGFVFVLRWWSAAWEVEPVEHTHKQYQRTVGAKSWRGGFRRLEIQFGDVAAAQKVDFIQFGQCLDLFTHSANTRISDKNVFLRGSARCKIMCASRKNFLYYLFQSNLCMNLWE